MRLTLSAKMIAAIKEGNLKRLKSVIEDAKRIGNIDYTAVQGINGVLQIDETLKYEANLFTPVLMALFCNKLDIARYFLEDL